MFSNINFISTELSNNQGVVVFINEQLKLNSELLLLDQQYHGLISKTIHNKLIFTGKTSQVKVMNSIGKDGEVKYLILVGLGDETKLQNFEIEEIGGKILSNCLTHKIKSVGIRISFNIGQYAPAIFACLIASGFLLASYKFDKYKTKQTDIDKFAVERLEISLDNPSEAVELFNDKKSLAEAIFFARDIINEPANIKNPQTYSERILEYLEPLGIEVTIIGEREMKNLRMGALLAVGQGSQNESKLVVMEYKGGNKDQPPVALVGKGVTFDSGGISLKPSANMGEMKYDMAGSAAVVGSLIALAGRQASANVVGVVGLVENMPSGNAQRPGDIVTTMSTKTVEVLDTDAEGRLVLADAIWYVQEKFSPCCVIDLATLTGAIVIALGATYAGCFSNNEQLANRLIEAGNKVNEKLWRMPMHKDFREMIKSETADIANINTAGRGANSSTAAHFIEHFVKEGMAWAHLDIAGVAYSKAGNNTGTKKGAVGYGVSLLNQLIKDYYEGQ
ncbi:leucyl aminopeptidase [Candidatus Tisiphia endosymbiont of Beris chalybata]|uniref:leucyl aminopeptidase n=1 Tax=Candidatus Tisiphia endosymbiont of Beris chalybata TaxID=3066262 RepID=UPI00312CC14E